MSKEVIERELKRTERSIDWIEMAGYILERIFGKTQARIIAVLFMLIFTSFLIWLAGKIFG